MLLYGRTGNHDLVITSWHVLGGSGKAVVDIGVGQVVIEVLQGALHKYQDSIPQSVPQLRSTKLSSAVHT